MTRAVIEVWGDIGPAMDRMSKLIEACAYSPIANGLAFRVHNMRVVVERKRVLIYNVKNEASARAVMEWLIDLSFGYVRKLEVS